MCAGCLRISCHPTTHPVRHLQTEHSFFSRWRTKDSQCVFRKPTVTEPILPRNLSYLGADGHCDHCGLWHLLSDILLALCWKNLLARVKGGYQPPPLSLSDTPPPPHIQTSPAPESQCVLVIQCHLAGCKSRWQASQWNAGWHQTPKYVPFNQTL